MVAAIRPKQFGNKYVQDWVKQEYMDVVRGRLYDSIHFAPGAIITRENSQFFRNVGVMSQKTQAMTNMQMPDKLPPPENFLVEKIILAFGSNTPETTWRTFIEKAVFEFWLMEKWYVRAPIISIPRMGNTNQKAPLKVCLACRSVSLDLTCSKCGAPEWEYLAYGGQENPDNGDMDGVKFIVDLAGGEISIMNQMHFSARLELSYGYTLPLGQYGSDGLSLWTILEGWHARGIC
jgi:hypothetical protein